MAAMTQFVAGATLDAADLNDIIDHLQGGAGEDDAYHFRSSSGNDFLITLSDAAGSRKFSLRDSGDVEIFAIDSNGNLTLSGTFSQSSFAFPTGATPTPTTEGESEWDTNDDLLAVGDSSGTKIIIPTPTTTAGDMEFADGARSHVRLAIGASRGLALETNSGLTAPQWAEPSIGRAVQGFVESGFGSLYFLPAASQLTFANNDSLGSLQIKMTATGTVTGAAQTELSGGYNLFVTATGDDAGFLGSTATSPTDDWVMGCRVVQSGSAAGQEFYMGLGADGSAFDGTVNSQLGWRLTNTGNYTGFTDNGGSETTRDSTNNDTSAHTLRMEISGGGGTVKFFFDNTQIGADVTTNIVTSTNLDIVCGATGTDAEDHRFFVSDFYAFRGN